MSIEQLTAIRALISHRRAQDPHSEQLIANLAKLSHELHSAIRLPQNQAPTLLARFILRYIEHVPDFIEAIENLTREAGILNEVQPLLTIACDYFLHPPDIVQGHSPMEQLLDEAYLAHRLLEEVNDRFIALSGVPLAPMDMTRANVIAHELIGEPFANELDQAVLFSAELLLSQHTLAGRNFRRYVDRHKTYGWTDELSRWPCLAENLAIGVHFGPELPQVHH